MVSPRAAALLLALSFACSLRQQGATDRLPMRPIPDQVAGLVRMAIADRHRAGDIPDQHLIAGQDPVLIFNEMEQSAYQLTPLALPAGARFTLIDRTVARERARGTLTGTAVLEVDRVELGPDTFSVVMGIGVVPDPSRPGFMMMCCCWARANYRLRAGQWSFDGWGESTCPDV